MITSLRGLPFYTMHECILGVLIIGHKRNVLFQYDHKIDVRAVCGTLKQYPIKNLGWYIIL
jgi:hypothetical protein